MKQEKELKRFSLNFDELESFTDPQNKYLPIHSFVDVYQSIGMYDFIDQYYKDNSLSKGTLTYMENVFAHPDTILKMRKLVQSNWETYDINIDGDNHVFWKPDSKYGKNKHYTKRLSKKVKGAVDRDFFDCCPGADPSVPKDEISLRVEEDVKEIEAEYTENK